MSIDLLDTGLDEDLVQWIQGYSNNKTLMSKQTMSVPGTVEDVIFRAPYSAALSRVDKHTAFLNATTAPLKAGRKRHRTSTKV